MKSCRVRMMYVHFARIWFTVNVQIMKRFLVLTGLLLHLEQKIYQKSVPIANGFAYVKKFNKFIVNLCLLLYNGHRYFSYKGLSLCPVG